MNTLAMFTYDDKIVCIEKRRSYLKMNEKTITSPNTIWFRINEHPDQLH